ncbi:MAG: helix-turn-helix transcriptional regulator [Lachnospiraceae bacterium]|jgi:transcriptional regulator with XRE-family HTH domain|nr:helix-turn-helix transcriptional regulator [Lachnospiraceae bacterium]MCI8871444.1 helix-turn-helix transcriptional regulator [Lachnospiraceae bacterium]MCI9059469.1 helix-turn-helix transcriptional regulator [Lachnospiraceae bacterium]GFI33043.1 HTH-type transcriptional regulator ImmR [Lachnospiraceae bacterium]
MQLGDHLRNIRESRDLKQTDVAKATHISNKILSNYERNICYPTIDNLIELCRFYQISADYLLMLTDKKTEPKTVEHDFPISSDEKRVIQYYRRLNEENRDCIRGLMVSYYKEQKSDAQSLPHLRENDFIP